MKTLQLFTSVFLFLASYPTAFALISVGELTKEQADQLGIQLRAKPGGPKHAWIELEFKPQGRFASFQHVSLEITDGDQLGLGWTPLKDLRTHDGNVIVRVMGSRAFLKNVTLRIIYDDFGGSGADIPLKKFVDFDQLKSPKRSGGGRQSDSTESPPASGK